MKLSIQQKLKEQGLTRYELAKRIGVTYPTIDNIYKGNSTSIKLDILEAICNEQTKMIIHDHNLYDSPRYIKLESLKVKIKDM